MLSMAVFVNQRQTANFLDAVAFQIRQYGLVRQRQLA
jgi:hypothetical protein